MIALFRIPVRPLDKGESGQVLLLAPDQVAYFFRGRAVGKNLIRATWNPPPHLSPNRIYVRTTKGLVLQAVHRSLEEILRQFGEPLFPIHQSLLTNLNAISSVYLPPAKPEVGMRVAAGTDYLRASRRGFTALRKRLMGYQSAT